MASWPRRRPAGESDAHDLSDHRRAPADAGLRAEIAGADLARDSDNERFAEIHDALMRHCVILFRDRHLTIKQHKDFGRRLGARHIHPDAKHGIPGHPEILVLEADTIAGRRVPATMWRSAATGRSRKQGTAR